MNYESAKHCSAPEITWHRIENKADVPLDSFTGQLKTFTECKDGNFDKIIVLRKHDFFSGPLIALHLSFHLHTKLIIT